MILCGLTDYPVAVNSYHLYKDGPGYGYSGIHKTPAQAPWVSFESHQRYCDTLPNGVGVVIWPFCGSCAAICWDDAEQFKTNHPHGCEVMAGDVDISSVAGECHVEKLTLSDGTILTMRFKLDKNIKR